jgi:hypothetical protein
MKNYIGKINQFCQELTVKNGVQVILEGDVVLKVRNVLRATGREIV